MGWLDGTKEKIRKRREAADDAGRKADTHDEPHEEGTRRGEARGPCYHIDPVTKKPMHPEGH